MVLFEDGELGGPEDRAIIEVEGEEITAYTSYDIHCGILTQPSAFSMTLGNNVVLKELQEKFAPGKRFKISIRGNTIMTGRLDGYVSDWSENGSQITIQGRDALAPLHDRGITANKSFDEATIYELVQAGLTETIDDLFVIQTTNRTNRQDMAGVTISQSSDPVGVEDPESFTADTQQKTKQLKVGTRWYDGVLLPHLQRAGLFLWAAGDGVHFILSAPNPNQQPTYRIVKQRGQLRSVSNALSGQLRNITTQRFSSFTIHGDRGSSLEGRESLEGTVEDEEMAAYGITRPLVMYDEEAKSVAQAQYLARRKLAESKRRGWSLQYPLSGHTTAQVGTGARCVIVNDTIVEIVDDEFGIDGSFYIENVHYHGSEETKATVTLMRPEDLIFGEEA